MRQVTPCDTLRRKDRALTRFALITILDEAIDFSRMFGYGFESALIENKLKDAKLIVQRQWDERAERSPKRRRRH